MRTFGTRFYSECLILAAALAVLPLAAAAQQAGALPGPLAPEALESASAQESAATADAPATDEAQANVADGGSNLDEIANVADAANADAAATDASANADATEAAGVTDPAAITAEVDAPDASNQAGVAADTSITETTAENTAGKFSASYFGIFDGPSVTSINSRYQPNSQGQTNFDRPIELRSWAGVGYNFTDEVSLTPVMHWRSEPIVGQGFIMEDPFIKLTDTSIWSNEDMNLFGEVRLHAPLGRTSRDTDQAFAVQFREVYGYGLGRFEVGLANSQWLRMFGKRGFGDDLTAYFGPYTSYTLTPTVSLVALYELQWSHFYGDRPFVFRSDGSDLELGVSWDITNAINLHPYLNFTTGGTVNASSTSVGALINVKFL